MAATIGFISRATTSADTRSRSWATENTTTSHPSEMARARSRTPFAKAIRVPAR